MLDICGPEVPLSYIEYFFTSHKSLLLATKNRNLLLSVLTKCGWLVSVPKHGVIAQRRKVIGLMVNTITMDFEIPQEKLETFFSDLTKVKSQSSMPVRLLTSFLGLLNSLSRVLGQVALLMTRNLKFLSVTSLYLKGEMVLCYFVI